MSYEEKLFNTCSVEVQKICLFLTEVHEATIRKIPVVIEALKLKGEKITSDERTELHDLEHRKKIEFDSMDAEFVYALSSIGSEFATVSLWVQYSLVNGTIAKRKLE